MGFHRINTYRILLAFLLACFSNKGSAQTAVLSVDHPATIHYSSTTPMPFVSTQPQLARSGRAVALFKHNADSDIDPAYTEPEVIAIARSLQYDPDLIFAYVHDKIEFSPLWGVLKGPVGTILDGRGNSFDQSVLMVALLTQATLHNAAISNPAFEFGQLHLTNTQLKDWLHVDGSPDSINSILAGGGIPGTAYADGSADIGHLWVKVSINGNSYIFDPAFKSHTWKPGMIDKLPNMMGYTQSQFVADANSTKTDDSIVNIKRDQLRDDLKQYAAAVDNYIQKNLPRASVDDLLGGGTINAFPTSNGQTVRQSSNPNQLNSPTEWTTIPDEFYASLSITLPGQSTPVPVFRSVDLYGHRLSIFFNASYVPKLYYDGGVVTTGKAATRGSSVAVSFEIKTAPLMPNGLPFIDQKGPQYIAAQTNENGGVAGYVIVNGWDQVGRGMIEKHKSLLNNALTAREAPSSEEVLGESLLANGTTWLAERAQQQRITDLLLGTTTQYVYGVGIAGEAVGPSLASPYVDLPFNVVNTPSRIAGTSKASAAASSLAAFVDDSGISSILESATLEQSQAQVSGFTAASTVKLLDTAIQNNDPLEDIDDSNWTTKQALMKPNYSLADLSAIDCWITGQSLPSAPVCNVQIPGSRVIAPLHGKITAGKWTGVGYTALNAVDPTSTTIESAISGGLSGGFGAVDVQPNIFEGNIISSLTLPSNFSLTSLGCSYLCGAGTTISGNGTGTGLIADPLDHTKGNYTNAHSDLSVGPKEFPYGLELKRLYDSGARNVVAPFGSGWTSNFAITATVASDPFAGTCGSTLLSCVDAIVALYVSSDLVKGQSVQPGAKNLEMFALEVIVNRWFADRLNQNVVNVAQGWTTEQFTLLSEGTDTAPTYAPPVGSVAILDKSSGSFRYRTKSGDTLGFNPTGQISTWTNAAGASANFTYSGANLARVTSATGRTFSFGYGGSARVTSVSDGSRTVKYDYTENRILLTFTDALSNKTNYTYYSAYIPGLDGYSLSGLLANISYPSNPTNAFISNMYDDLERVMQQQDAEGHITTAFFSGTRTEIDDPTGVRHVWNLDAQGNVLSEIQDFGPSPHLNITTVNTYDTQSNLISALMPEGDSIGYTYDALNNPLSITHTPKPGSALAPRVTALTYITPVTSLPNFEEVETYKDPAGNVTSYSYDSSKGTLSKSDPPAIIKPGFSSGIVPEQTFTYTGLGLLQTSQDAEGRVKQYDYDPAHSDQVVKVTVDSGRLNLASQYGYDAVGNVTSVMDANNHKTSMKYDNLRHLIEEDAAVSGVVTKKTYFPDGPVKTVSRQINTTTSETTSYTYTLSDNVSTVTDPLGNTTTATYDNDDRVATVTQSITSTKSRQKSYSYDALGRIYQLIDSTAGAAPTVLETHAYTLNGKEASFADANGNAISYGYDGFDEQNLITYPDSSTETFAYDSDANVLQKTTRSGKTIDFTYDALNRLATKTPQDEIAGQVTYGYDLTGLLLQASDGSSTTPYSIGYDTAGRPISYTDQQGRAVQVAYDLAGNRTELHWPVGTDGSGSYWVKYAFDAMNRMTNVLENGTTPLAQYTWDTLSRPTLISYGDNTSDAFTQYDLADNLKTLAMTFSGPVVSTTFNYTWFNNHQRQSTQTSDGRFLYLPNPGTISYGGADANNGYTSISDRSGTANITYDTNKNLQFDGARTLTFDVENRLVQAQSMLSGTSQYLYDPLGHRKLKQAQGIVKQFVLAGDQEIADYQGSGVGIPFMLTVRGAGNQPIAAISPSTGAHVYYHPDIIGSTVASTTPGTSGPAEFYVYDDYGSSFGGMYLPYRFAGYRFDDETGLYYVGARYYSPTAGRFLQPDPAGTSGGNNLYAYVDNDPINLTDPTGLSAQETGSDSAQPQNAYPLTDSSGNTVLGANGQPALIPSGFDVSGVVQAGEFNSVMQHVPDPGPALSLLLTGAELTNFGRGNSWDLQRLNGSFDARFVDSATILIGMYSAAAGVPRSVILNIENVVAGGSHYAEGTPMDSTYTNLPVRNVTNTDIGMGLVRSGAYVP